MQLYKLTTIIVCNLLLSCNNQKEAPKNPYEELGDTVPASEFEPVGKDTCVQDTTIKDSILHIKGHQKMS